MTTAIGRKSDSDFASHILGNMLNMDEYGLFERFGIFLVKSAVRNKCNSASNTTSGEWCVGGQRATLHRVPKFHVKHRNFYDRKEMWGKRYFFVQNIYMVRGGSNVGAFGEETVGQTRVLGRNAF